ncbi:hypothetical protein ACFP81_10700 [Deinococcus lacus]|uniref:Peptidase C51 domain-containing protein n=1 Tax=Deinococcus lacus TaxID=392561 RepID=A0ABW1YDJ6_9DEIO
MTAPSNPMQQPKQHDRFALLDGAKEILLPGIASVSASLKANTDTLEIAGGGGNEQVEINPPAGEVTVKLTMWDGEQWEEYQNILARLRKGDGKGGPAQFTCAHPEVRSRRIKRLYFQSEDAEGYKPRDGYRATLRFTEALKPKASAPVVDNGTMQNPGVAPLGGTSTGSTGRGTATLEGAKVLTAAMGHLPPDPPEPADGGRANTAKPGYCSAFARVVGTRAGLPRSLFGGTAKVTEDNFRAAGLSRPWGGAQNLRLGDFVFWHNDPSGAGHVGVVVGFAKDGMPLIANNSSINKPDGRAINRLDQLSTRTSQPTSYARAGGFGTEPQRQGPAVPVPTNSPSANLRR